MNKKRLGFAMVLTVAILMAPITSTVLAKNPTPTDYDDYKEYVGVLGGADFVVRIPNEGWNHMLVVGCHGWFPPQIPFDATALDWVLLNSDGDGLPFVLLEQGYAYAASSYGEGGWPIKEAMIHTHQLTRYVIGKFGVTGKVFLIGHSMGGAISLLLGEKYPELYDGVLDISGMKDIVMGYNDAQNIIAQIEFLMDTMPPAVWEPLLPTLWSLRNITADMEAEYGGTYVEKPQHYEKLNPVDNAEIHIPMITVNGADDPLTSDAQGHSFENAVEAAGCSEYYELYTADPGGHGDPDTVDEALSHFDELVNYPNPPW